MQWHWWSMDPQSTTFFFFLYVHQLRLLLLVLQCVKETSPSRLRVVYAQWTSMYSVTVDVCSSLLIVCIKCLTKIDLVIAWQLILIVNSLFFFNLPLGVKWIETYCKSVQAFMDSRTSLWDLSWGGNTWYIIRPILWAGRWVLFAVQSSGGWLGATWPKGNLQWHRTSCPKHSPLAVVDGGGAGKARQPRWVPFVLGAFLLESRADLSFGRATSQSITQRLLGSTWFERRKTVLFAVER